MNNKIFFLPDRLAHYREPVFLELAKILIRNSKKLYLFYDPNDAKITQIPIPKLDKLSSYFSIVRVKNLYFRSAVVYQFNVISKYIKYRPDILIAWGESQRISTLFLMFFSKLYRKKVVLWTHGFYGNEGYIKKLWRIFFYKFSDKFLVYGEYGASLLRKYLPNKDVHVIGNSIKIEKSKLKFINYESLKKHKMNLIQKYNIGDQKSLLDSSTIILSFVGRLTKAKNLKLLINLLSKKKAKNIKLWIIGKGPEGKNLKEYADLLGVNENVYFFGEIYNQKEVKSILSASDIFVCPRNLGLSICNALSAGIPVITTNNSTMQMPEYEILNNFEYADFVDFEDSNKVLKKINLMYKKVILDFKSKNKIINHYYSSFDPKMHGKRIIESISEYIY